MQKTINPPVFYTSAFLVLTFVCLAIVFTDTFEEITSLVNNSVNTYMGWFLILSVSIFFFFALYLGFSKFGDLRLSSDNTKPQYSFLTWLAMLFSAGMGIGLLFYGVAEPVLHYSNPALEGSNSIETAKTAMNLSFLHWGFHAWATYIIMGLGIAYFTYRKGYPLSIRYIFYPIFKNRIYGPLGHTIDILAVLGTLFGVATSLGLGAMQINAGLSFLTDIPNTVFVQVILITIISLIALISVVSGVNKGIKWLSVFNMSVASFLLIFVLIFGPTVFILKAFLENTGNYLQNFIELSFWNAAFLDIDWQSKWTIFYWSWWIAWSPYVGMFIARVSRGRTIREFILGVLIVPSLLSFLWLTAFGSTGIYMDTNGDDGIVSAANADITTALFYFFEHFPFVALISGLAIIAIISFFVTSSDSGSLVIDMITAGGSQNSPVWQRIFWALLGGIVAASLLLGGGLVALQTITLCLGLPFAVVMLLICFSLYKGMRSEEFVELKEKYENQIQENLNTSDEQGDSDGRI